MSRTPPALWVLGITATIAASAGFMYLVTTFLFAFSGGQYRMVAVVNSGAIAMLVLPTVVAAVAWRLRSAAFAAIAVGVACGAGWVATAVIEWLLSFSLGA